MKIIIVGAGEIGTHIALSLAEQRHQIVVIEADEHIAAELNSRIDARVVAGDGSSIGTLVDAGVGECDLFLSLTSDNNINLVSASVAKHLGAKRNIARVHPNLQREGIFLDYEEHFGIDYLFSSERLAAVELAKFVRNPESSQAEEIARGYVEIQETEVAEGSPHAGRPLTEIDFPDRVRVGAIRRRGETIIPSAEDQLLPGDMVTLSGDPKLLRDFTQELNGRSGKEARKSVVIFGGGEYGYSLAQTLQGLNCHLRIFERDTARCEELSDLLTDVTILNADATSVSEMKEERIGEADFFIAVTGTDEDNVMTCLQAHTLGTRYCLPLIHRADYADTMTRFGDRLGILAAVSPREATRKDLSRFIVSDRFHLLKKLEGVELIEACVMPEATIAGQTVREIPWPKDCVLVAMVHGTRAKVPAADDVVAHGDNIYALIKPKAKRQFLKLVAP